MTSDTERREVARRLRAYLDTPAPWHLVDVVSDVLRDNGDYDKIQHLADLIEPIYKPDAEYEAWYNSLSHYGDERGGPSTIRELIEEIVWTALTVDLGPNGNTDSTGVDEGRVYTDKLFAEWEREALRLSGGCDSDALLALADELEQETGSVCGVCMGKTARRIREALGVDDG